MEHRSRNLNIVWFWQRSTAACITCIVAVTTVTDWTTKVEPTPSPRIPRFQLVRFPLTRILAYVCASGGILH